MDSCYNNCIEYIYMSSMCCSVAAVLYLGARMVNYSQGTFTCQTPVEVGYLLCIVTLPSYFISYGLPINQMVSASFIHVYLRIHSL